MYDDVVKLLFIQFTLVLFYIFICKTYYIIHVGMFSKVGVVFLITKMCILYSDGYVK